MSQRKRNTTRSRSLRPRVDRYVVLIGGLNLRIGRTSDPSGISLQEAKAAAPAHLDHAFFPGGRPDPDYKDRVYAEILPRLRREIESLTSEDVDDEDHEQSIDWLWPLTEYPLHFQLDRLPESYRARLTEKQLSRVWGR